MEIVNTISLMKSLRKELTGSVGFVPTMGYLHEGHMSLVRQAKVDNSVTVVSIFVNPSQFGPKEDLKNYPRNVEHDLSLLIKVNTDIALIPSDEEMYPAGFNSWIEVQKITERLEGECRPGHFKGVATIVAKLFNIIEPTRAYFGQKDAQQALVIQKMVADLNMNLKVIVLPTIREEDGLAMSSRNIYLNAEERKSATVLFKALTRAKEIYQNGEDKAENIRQEMLSIISKEPLAMIDYISISDSRTLEDLTVLSKPALISMAVRIGKTRLIDNIVLK
jgi:pantoate--beta-alanine ligase